MWSGTMYFCYTYIQIYSQLCNFIMYCFNIYILLFSIIVHPRPQRGMIPQVYGLHQFWGLAIKVKLKMATIDLWGNIFQTIFQILFPNVVYLFKEWYISFRLQFGAFLPKFNVIAALGSLEVIKYPLVDQLLLHISP